MWNYKKGMPWPRKYVLAQVKTYKKNIKSNKLKIYKKSKQIFKLMGLCVRIIYLPFTYLCLSDFYCRCNLFLNKLFPINSLQTIHIFVCSTATLQFFFFVCYVAFPQVADWVLITPNFKNKWKIKRVSFCPLNNPCGEA